MSHRVLVTGASGLVGRRLGQELPIVGMPRRDLGGPWWEPLNGVVHDTGEPLAAVVHLAGENVAGARWTPEHKARVLDSRVKGTRTLVDWLAGRSQRPSVLVAASATGLYGDRGDEVLDEQASRGDGFLADVVEAWEAEIHRASALGIRVVVLRIGLVLSPEGGALRTMLPAFRAGVGGPLGSGRQWFPWVHLDDAVGAVVWALRDGAAEGAYNVVSPGIVQQARFARSLGRAVHRPARLRAPAFALRAVFGELANEALLSSTRAVPRRLEEEGFSFSFPDLDGALADLL